MSDKTRIPIIIGHNNYVGLTKCAGQKGFIVGTREVRDTTYAGRPCYPASWTTHYDVETEDGKVGGILFAGQFKRL